MTEAEAIQLFKCLADRSRLQILKSLNQEDMYVERLAQRLNLSPSTVSFHLKKLEEAGAVRAYKSQYYAMYTLCRPVFDTRILDIIAEESEEATEQARRDAAYRRKVIDTFFHYGKLTTIPTQRKKRRIVLEKIVESFESGKLYSEREVNLVIADYNEDFCTIRRELIAEQLMNRDKTGYWRMQLREEKG